MTENEIAKIIVGAACVNCRSIAVCLNDAIEIEGELGYYYKKQVWRYGKIIIVSANRLV